MKIIKYITSALALTLMLSTSGCSESFLNTEPSTSVGEGVAEGSESGLQSILDGIHYMTYGYNWGSDTHSFGTGQASISANLDMMGDDLINSMPAVWMGTYRYENHIDPNAGGAGLNYKTWDFYYTIILHANKIINATAKVNLTENGKARLLGESYAFRAWAYHNLVQLFGKRYVKGAANDQLGVVIRLGDNLMGKIARSTVAQVYAQIDADMKLSLDNLKIAKDISNKNAIRYSTACGIAARIALSKSDWENAEKYATEAIATSGATLQKGKELCDGFNSIKSTEWMWGYAQGPTQDFGYFSFFVNYSYNFNGYNRSLRYAVNRTIYDKMGAKDSRRGWWVCLDRGDKIPEEAYVEDPKDKSKLIGNGYFLGDTRAPDWETTGQSIKFKAKGQSDSHGDLLMMRLAEMYYIKAEAQARQSNDAGAKTTLMEIMVTRDPDYTTTAVGSDLIDEVMRNKRIDLWLEGRRFFDIKRLGIIINRASAANINYMSAANKTRFLTRNSGKLAEKIPTTLDSKYWEFAIPYEEIKGNDLCVQNPL